MQGPWVPSLLGELRSHTPRSDWTRATTNAPVLQSPQATTRKIPQAAPETQHSQETKLKLHQCLNKFSSVQLLSRVQLFVAPWTQHTRPPCPSPTLGVYPNSCPLSRWCHPAISSSSSVVPSSSCLQSFPASGSFQMSQLFTSGGQSIGVSATISVLPMNTQECPNQFLNKILHKLLGLFSFLNNFLNFQKAVNTPHLFPTLHSKYPWHQR